MKKIICIILSLTLTMMLFCGCSNSRANESKYSEEVIVEEIIIDNTSNNSSVNSTPSNTETPNQTDTSSQDTVSQNTSSKVDPANCSHSYDNGQIEQTAALFKAGTKKYSCTKCGDSYTATYPVEKIQILSIGNSYSLNSMWELYSLCEQAGVKEIDIAIMYIGGCSLDAHWENAQNNASAYELYRNNNGKWITTKDYSIENIITEKDWDVITLQNSSYWAGNSNGYSNLDNMTNYVSEKCPNAKIVWHMIWGYQNGSEWLTPNNYNGDEMLMYNSIVECTQKLVVPNNKIHSIAPVGTAIMNARTSRIKTQVHQDDGSHLSEDIGYYIGAFAWFGHLTGMPLYDVNPVIFNPTTSNNIDIIRESAQNAIKTPYKITHSYYAN